MKKLIDTAWESLDASRSYHYKQDRLQIANKLGYKYISEAVVRTYLKLQSIPKTAKVLGTTYSSARADLLRMGVKLNSRGGRNNPFGRNGFSSNRRGKGR